MIVVQDRNGGQGDTRVFSLEFGIPQVVFDTGIGGASAGSYSSFFFFEYHT